MEYSFSEDIIEKIFDRVKNSMIPSEKNNFKPVFLRSNFLLYAVMLLLACKVIFISVAVNLDKTLFFADITKATLQSLANNSRVSAGLQPLTESKKLDEAARLKAESMIAEQYFSHVSPNGVSPWHWFLKAGYSYKYAGENLAIGFYDSREVYEAWLNSPSHKANILNPNYREFGTAIAGGFGDNGAIIVVQLFGSEQAPVISQKQEKTEPLNQKVEKPEEPKEPGRSAVVLSSETNNFFEPSTTAAKANFYSKAMNLFMYDFTIAAKDAFFGVSVLLATILVLASYNLRRPEDRPMLTKSLTALLVVCIIM